MLYQVNQVMAVSCIVSTATQKNIDILPPYQFKHNQCYNINCKHVELTRVTIAIKVVGDGYPNHTYFVSSY